MGSAGGLGSLGRKATPTAEDDDSGEEADADADREGRSNSRSGGSRVKKKSCKENLNTCFKKIKGVFNKVC